MELDQGFKDRVRWAINVKETSQSALARHLGVSPQAIQQWVAGATLSPRREHVAAAADFLGCRYDWLAYGRGPMKEPAGNVGDRTRVAGASNETVLLSREWDEALRAAIPNGDKEHLRPVLQHPSGNAHIHAGWVSDTLIADIGLYRTGETLVQNARQKLWMLAVLRNMLPQIQGRRALLVLAPLDTWRESPERHVEALRAEARTLGIDVVHVGTPEQAAAVLCGHEQAPVVPVELDLGLEVTQVL